MAKEELPDLVPEFADRLEAVGARRTTSCTATTGCPGWSGSRLRRSHGLPLVHTMHTMARIKNGSRPAAGPTEPDLRGLGESQIVSGAEILTANTTDEAADLVRAYGARPDKIAVVPPGVDLHTFHPCDQQQSRELLGVDPEAQVVLFVGRIQPLKAPDVLIRAVARLVEREPRRREHLRLIVIGSASGPDAGWSGTLAPLAAGLGVADLVEFRPHAERSELFRYYCVSDVVGVPSYSESFGLVALEAQACGRPVVATDAGGLRHAVRDGHTGRLVDGPRHRRLGRRARRDARPPGRARPARRQRRRARLPLQLVDDRGRDARGVRRRPERGPPARLHDRRLVRARSLTRSSALGSPARADASSSRQPTCRLV